jgi:hypothetical protein
VQVAFESMLKAVEAERSKLKQQRKVILVSI